MSATAPPPVPVIEFSLASRGISKGLAQTRGAQFVVRGELADGPIYIGGYWKNVTSTTSGGEAGATVGVRAKVGGFNLAAGATLKMATSRAAGSDDKALELSGAISRKVGRLTPQLAVIWSPNDLGATGRSTFVEASAAYGLFSHTTVSAAIGRRYRVGGANYTAFNAGITQTLAKNFTADVRYYGTNRHGLGYTYQPGLVASVRARF
jgi:hypothetical protein